MDKKKLEEIRKEYQEKLAVRLDKNFKGARKQVLICGGTDCHSNKAGEIIDLFRYEIKKQKLDIDVIMVGCLGLCSKGPVIIIKPDDILYTMTKLSDVDEIIDSHLKNDKVVERLLYKENNKVIPKLEDIPFYQKQTRIVLKNAGKIDPENIFEYIAVDGYFALSKAMFSMTKEEIIDTVKDSNLRGRGGAGFKTGLKWEMAYQEKDPIKYVACNADEGDPGAFMDRSILEANPHAIIEAMTILAYAIDAKKGFVYIRHEYPVARYRLEKAIHDARENNLLGKNILGTKFSFDIEVRLGAGSYVCGEETALMESVMGRRGEPRLRPPYPTHMGIFKHPTVLNNVETYANIPPIILNGSAWFKKFGTKDSTGTKVFALAGSVNNTGLIEIEMGTPLREVIYELGGGMKNNHSFKFAQTGGPSGGCIPYSLIDTPLDYESLKKIHTIVGSGGLIIMDDTACPVDIAKFFLSFSCYESCGKCTPCRLGNRKIYEMLDKISRGEGCEEDITKLEEWCHYVKENSLCGLGQSSPNPVLSTLEYFKNEYLEHLHGTCRSACCKELVSYRIDTLKCIGCGLCKRNCQYDAIEGEVKHPHKIDKEKCQKCGLCFKNCPVKAIVKE